MNKLVESMVEEMARAIDAALGYDMPRDDVVAAAQACAAIAQKRVNELEAALAATIPALEGQIESLLGSYTNLIGPDMGKVTDPDGLAWIAEFQEPLDKARAALPTMLKGNGDG